MIAGYVDACGLHSFGTFVSFMSGNTTHAGVAVGAGRFAAALPFATAIVFFVTGSAAGAWVGYPRLPRPRPVLFGLVAALLAAALAASDFAGGHGDGDGKIAGIAALSMAMGMLNNALPKVGPESVNLTFVTGNLNRMARHLALGLRRAPLPDAQGPGDTHLRRARLLASIWAGFFGGAVLCAAGSAYLGRWMLLPPLVILLGLAPFTWWRTREPTSPPPEGPRAAAAPRG